MYLNNSKASQDSVIPVKNVKDNVGIFKDTPKTFDNFTIKQQKCMK